MLNRKLKGAYLAGVSAGERKLAEWAEESDLTPQQLARDWFSSVLACAEQERAGFCDAIGAYMTVCMHGGGVPIIGTWQALDELTGAEVMSHG